MNSLTLLILDWNGGNITVYFDVLHCLIMFCKCKFEMALVCLSASLNKNDQIQLPYSDVIYFLKEELIPNLTK